MGYSKFFATILSAALLTTPLNELPNVNKSIVINLTGDLCVATPYGNENNGHNYYNKYGSDYYLDNVREIFENDDYTVVNLENVFTDEVKYLPGKIWSYKSKMKYLDIITNSSIEVVGLMNNHSQDYYQKGLDDTIAALEKHNIVPIGFNDVSSYSYPELGGAVMDKKYIMESNGVKVGIVAYLGFNTYYANEKQVQKDFKELKEQGADYIIVYPHWGNNNEKQPHNGQKTRARMYIDNGADLVVGNHAHILQPMEEYKGKRVYYSLGDFLFFHRGSREDNLTFILNLKLEKDKEGNIVENFNHIPLQWTGSTTKNVYQPYILTGESSVKRLANRIGVSEVEITLDGSYYKSFDIEEYRRSIENKIKEYITNKLKIVTN